MTNFEYALSLTGKKFRNKNAMGSGRKPAAQIKRQQSSR